MTNKKEDSIPDELELRSLHRFLEKKSIYDLEVAADYDECGTSGWWSNDWNDWDELRQEERYDYWFSRNPENNEK